MSSAAFSEQSRLCRHEKKEEEKNVLYTIVQFAVRVEGGPAIKSGVHGGARLFSQARNRRFFMMIKCLIGFNAINE